MAFTRSELDSMLVLAEAGLNRIADLQDEMTAVPPPARRT
jgi:ribonuclease PH